LTHFLVDENIPRNVRDWLKKKGFEVTYVSETNLRMAKDQIIAEYAVKNNLTILTLDIDYAQIYHTLRRGTLSVIVVRANPSTASNILETLIIAHQKINLKEVKNKLVMITRKRIRIIS
jgi:predicted nuclease of predicted toxin-antitoxin system